MLSFVTAKDILVNELQMPYSVFYLIIFVVKVAVIVVDILRYLSSLYGKATLVFVRRTPWFVKRWITLSYRRSTRERCSFVYIGHKKNYISTNRAIDIA